MSFFDNNIYAGSGNFYDLQYYFVTTGVPAGAYAVFNLPRVDVRRVEVRPLINGDQRWKYSETGTPVPLTALPPMLGSNPWLYTGMRNEVFIPTLPLAFPAPVIEFMSPSQPITHLVCENRASGQILSGVIYGYASCPRFGMG